MTPEALAAVRIQHKIPLPAMDATKTIKLMDGQVALMVAVKPDTGE